MGAAATRGWVGEAVRARAGAVARGWLYSVTVSPGVLEPSLLVAKEPVSAPDIVTAGGAHRVHDPA